MQFVLWFDFEIVLWVRTLDFQMVALLGGEIVEPLEKGVWMANLGL